MLPLCDNVDQQGDTMQENKGDSNPDDCGFGL